MNIKLFEYINSDGHIVSFPFRVGDIVKVKYWGDSYSSYKDAFVHFTGKCQSPYYSSFLHQQDRDDARENASEFKIIGVAEHGQFKDCIIAYIQDRMGRGQVIGLEGLELVKQLPLRIGEKTVIKLEKIKEI
jgi:hypothetical protein